VKAVYNFPDPPFVNLQVPLGLRERLFKSAALGDISSWAPPPRGSLTAAAAAADGSAAVGNPTWLDEF
jgi:hypothetical protein